jgi:hypothetical protein
MLVAEPKRGPFGALFAAIQRSHRRGWILFAVPASIFFVQLLGSSVVETVARLLGGETGGPVHFIFSALEAAIMAAGALALALLQAAAYRVVAGARQGI